MIKFNIETFKKESNDFVSDFGFVDTLEKAKEIFEIQKQHMKTHYQTEKDYYIELNKYSNIEIDDDGSYNCENAEIENIESFELD